MNSSSSLKSTALTLILLPCSVEHGFQNSPSKSDLRFLSSLLPDCLFGASVGSSVILGSSLIVAPSGVGSGACVG